MNLVKMKIQELKTPEYNPRKSLVAEDEEYKKIKKSIEEFGYVDPVIVNSKNKNIVGGNQRYKVLQDLGYNEIDCILIDIEESKEKALNIALNKISGEWDNEKLYKLLDEIKSIDDNNFFSTGFDNKDFKQVKKDFELSINYKNNIKDDNFDEEKATEEVENKKIITKFGDIYQLGNHYLFCGDSTKIEDINKIIQYTNNDIKNTLVFTDPPYGLNIVGRDNQVGRSKITKANKYKEIIGDQTIEAAKNNYNHCIELGFDKFIIWGGNYFFEFLDFKEASWIVWDKRGDMNSNDFGDGEIAYSSLNHPIRIYKHIWSGMIQEGKREKRVHPTQKPIIMICNVIRSFMGKNLFNNIIDFFGGSGSTLISCENLKLPCITFEIDPFYCDIIINRYIKFKSNISSDVFLIDNNKKISWKDCIK
jgi:DNA modification methylase